MIFCCRFVFSLRTDQLKTVFKIQRRSGVKFANLILVSITDNGHCTWTMSGNHVTWTRGEPHVHTRLKYSSRRGRRSLSKECSHARKGRRIALQVRHYNQRVQIKMFVTNIIGTLPILAAGRLCKNSDEETSSERERGLLEPTYRCTSGTTWCFASSQGEVG